MTGRDPAWPNAVPSKSIDSANSGTGAARLDQATKPSMACGFAILAMMLAHPQAAAEAITIRNGTTGVTEHPLEDRVDVLGVVAEVEFLLDLGRGKRPSLRHRRAVPRGNPCLRFPDLHGVALDQPVGVLPADARLGQRQQHALRMHQAAELVHVLRSCCRDRPRASRSRRPAGAARSRGARSRPARCRARRRSARCRARARAPRSPSPGSPPCAPAGQGRSGSPSAPGCACAAWPTSPSGPARNTLRLPAPRCAACGGLRGDVLDGRRDDAQRGEEHRVPVARDDLRGDRLGPRPSFSQTCSSTAGSILAKVPTAPEIAPVATSLRAFRGDSRLRSISA
jgi:hypothetical protein